MSFHDQHDEADMEKISKRLGIDILSGARDIGER
jgi:hypothetical protein